MHLNETELIDHLEGTLPVARAEHVAACERCRRQAETLAAALGDARGADVPEPSPLVWDHFSARVREAIAAEGPAGGARTSWFRWPRVALAGAAVAALAIVVMSAALWLRDRQTPTDAGTIARQDASAAPIEQAPETDLEWSFVASMADDIDWDDAQAAGLAVPPGAAERAALQLSDDEQTELARLLREEMGGSL